MALALETLGYHKTSHSDALFNPYEIDMWMDAINAKFFGKGKPYQREDWDHLLGRFQAVTDAPHYLFAKELIEAYPEAKVVLVTRDADSWWRSMKATVEGFQKSRLVRINAWLDPAYAGKVEALFALMQKALWGVKDWTQEEELCKTKFRAHYDEVRRPTPPGRLLEFELKQGWEPLCKFLGKEVPDEPFPHLFNTAAFQEMLKRRDRALAMNIARKLTPMLVLAISVGVGVFYFRGNMTK
ncbi:NAD dependent epimerase [Mycena metata]|uniref:NAD dependent epimerase n=1 Tax=Mycena metata TaxID=1033252 RepID=A0AAD7HJV6_9AGAR|nr:NAD dependent epimerase [Mycena metata]